MSETKGAILFKDVIRRHSIRNPAFLERLVPFLADNAGSLVSAKKICDFLKSQKIKMARKSISKQLTCWPIKKLESANLDGSKASRIITLDLPSPWFRGPGEMFEALGTSP